MGKIFEAQTEHVLPFKMLVEVLKEILNDVTIEVIRDDSMNKITTDQDPDSAVESDEEPKKGKKKDSKKK